MNRKKILQMLIGIGLCGMIFGASDHFVASSFAGEIILVCNNSVPVGSLDKKEVRRIFLGKEIEWENKDKIVLTILKTTKLHRQFLEKYVGMTPSKYRTYWKQMLFTGKTSSSPEDLANEETLLEYVAETIGAIGYVSADTEIDNVKIISDNTE